MDDLPVVNMLESQAELRKPVENLILREISALGLPYCPRHVASLCIVHDYIEVTAFRFEATDHLHDGRVVQSLEYASLLHGVLLLLIAAVLHVDLLEHALLASVFVVHEVALPEGALAEHLDFLEVAHVHGLNQYNCFNSNSNENEVRQCQHERSSRCRSRSLDLSRSTSASSPKKSSMRICSSSIGALGRPRWRN